jgi:cell fate (sporulation/competence/biofilm development) regulator YlbF (YheA/YmcA/DUF963 family)
MMDRSLLHQIKEDIEGENDAKSLVSKIRNTKIEFNTVETKGAKNSDEIAVEEAKDSLPQDEKYLQNDIQTKNSSGKFRNGTANFNTLEELIDQ